MRAPRADAAPTSWDRRLRRHLGGGQVRTSAIPRRVRMLISRHIDAPTALRYGGMLATTLLAAAGYAAGALPDRDPAVAMRVFGLGQPRYLAGLLLWLAGTILLAVVWWRLGRLLGAIGEPASPPAGFPRRAALGLRWLLNTAALWALPLVVAPPLGSRDVYAYACQGALYLDGHDPYTVGPGAGGCPWLAAVPQIWRDTPAPYGPLAVLTSAAGAGLARALPLDASTQLLVAVGALRLAALAGVVLCTGYLVRLARRLAVAEAVAAWLGVATPVVLGHAVSGAHNDALLAGLVLAMLSIAQRAGVLRLAVLAGFFGGLACAVKVTALVALPFAVLLVARADRSPTGPTDTSPTGGAALLATGWIRSSAPRAAGWVRRDALRAVGWVQRDAPRAGSVRGGALLAAAGGAFAALTVAGGFDLGWTRGLARSGEMVQWTSLPTGVGMAVGYFLRAFDVPDTYPIAVFRTLGLAVLAGLLVAVWWWARRQPPRGVVRAAGIALAATAVLSPVFYPWYAITPLAVLAASLDHVGRRAAAIATVVLGFLVLPSGLGLAVLTKLPGALADVALVSAALWYAVRRFPVGRARPRSRAS